MAALVVVGFFAGVLLAYWTNKGKRNFRARLLRDLDEASKAKSLKPFVKGLLHEKRRWVKSLGWVRKPFSKEVNLAIETAVLIYAGVGTVNALTAYEKYFSSQLQGHSVIFLLGVVLGFIPGEWLVSWRAERQIDMALAELESAMNEGRLDAYVAEICSSCRMDNDDEKSRQGEEN